MLTAELPVHFDQQPLIIVMGVSGSGKSTLGIALAQHLHLPFLDADNFHPAANVDKMSRAIPLTDEDRWPWLLSLCQAVNQEVGTAGGAVATCSALKRRYRDFIRTHIKHPLVFVLLDGTRETLLKRMQQRNDHYMPPSLLDSQLADLERPAADEPSLTFSIAKGVDELSKEIVSKLISDKQY